MRCLEYQDGYVCWWGKIGPQLLRILIEDLASRFGMERSGDLEAGRKRSYQFTSLDDLHIYM